MSEDRAPRRAVELRGIGTWKNGSSFPLQVLNLSETGCRIATEETLGAGDEFFFSIPGIAGSMLAVVRWRKADIAGVQFRLQSEDQPKPANRRDERPQAVGIVGLRRPGRSNYQVRVFDLTPNGCKVEFVERPKNDETVWLKFEDLAPLEAKVRWVDGFYGGLEFVCSIHPSVFDALMHRLKK